MNERDDFNKRFQETQSKIKEDELVRQQQAEALKEQIEKDKLAVKRNINVLVIYRQTLNALEIKRIKESGVMPFTINPTTGEIFGSQGPTYATIVNRTGFSVEHTDEHPEGFIAHGLIRTEEDASENTQGLTAQATGILYKTMRSWNKLGDEVRKKKAWDLYISQHPEFKRS